MKEKRDYLQKEIILKIGDIVTLRSTSQINGLSFTHDKYNPVETEGEIVQIYNPKMPELPYIVRWSNGYTNSYQKENLIKK